MDWAGVDVGAEAAESDSHRLPWDILLHILHGRHMCGEHNSSALKLQFLTSCADKKTLHLAIIMLQVQLITLN